MISIIGMKKVFVSFVFYDSPSVGCEYAGILTKEAVNEGVVVDTVAFPHSVV